MLIILLFMKFCVVLVFLKYVQSELKYGFNHYIHIVIIDCSFGPLYVKDHLLYSVTYYYFSHIWLHRYVRKPWRDIFSYYLWLIYYNLLLTCFYSFLSTYLLLLITYLLAVVVIEKSVGLSSRQVVVVNSRSCCYCCSSSCGVVLLVLLVVK